MTILVLKLRTWIPQARILVPSPPATLSYFRGDGRDEDFYSSKYRTFQQFTIDTNRSDYDVKYFRDIGETSLTTINRYSGETISELKATAPISGLTYSNKRVINDELLFDVTCAAADPLVPVVAPDINYSFTIKVTRSGKVKIQGSHDGFPGFEFWRQVGLNLPELIWSHHPGTTGESIGSLFGSGEHTINEEKAINADPSNSVVISSSFIPKGNYNRPGTFMKPKFITVHNTANTAPSANAAMHASYVKNPSTQVSWHFTVDDGGTIYQHLPTFEAGYHAGDYQGNRESIGIEICENAGSNFERSVRNAQALIKMLMRQLNIPLMNVVPHQFWSGKNCPRLLLDRWDSFILGIADSSIPLANVEDSPDPTDYAVGPSVLLQGATGSEVVQLQKDLINVGESIPSGADGVYGAETKSAVLSFQQRYGLTVDGIAGLETQGKLASVLNSAFTYGDKGPEVVRLQKNLISVGESIPSGADGVYGQETLNAVRSFQKKAGLNIDGIAGPKTLRELAEYLSSALTYGDSGTAVSQLQKNLISSGESLPSGADGVYGLETVNAVRSFQQKYNLTADGIAGPKTQGKLVEVLNSTQGLALLPGDSGPTVAQLQRDLISVGESLKYGIDGSYGPDTASAVRSFQQKHGLAVDGIAGAQTQGKLTEVLSSPLTPGKTGTAVVQLQRNLMNAGEVLPHGADGIYGTETESAVRSFQRRYGLVVDGIAGRQTQAKLRDVLEGVGLTLMQGDSGSSVIQLQQNLMKVGMLLPSGADGVYGSETVKAVRSFQEKYGLYVDGIAGQQTQAKLEDLL